MTGFAIWGATALFAVGVLVVDYRRWSRSRGR